MKSPGPHGYAQKEARFIMAKDKKYDPKTGDIVEIEWYDTHSTGRLTHEDIEDLEDPSPTLAYGLILRNGPRYITLASEICLDPHSDGSYIEQIPYRSITRARRLGKRALDGSVQSKEGTD